MTMQVENSVREAEQHLLRAEAEMAKAELKIVEAAKTCSDQRLHQLADVLSAHTLLVSHLAAITGSAFYPNLSLEPGISLPGRRATQLF